MYIRHRRHIEVLIGLRGLCFVFLKTELHVISLSIPNIDYAGTTLHSNIVKKCVLIALPITPCSCKLAGRLSPASTTKVVVHI